MNDMRNNVDRSQTSDNPYSTIVSRIRFSRIFKPIEFSIFVLIAVLVLQ